VANETSQANAQSTALALVNAESDGQAGHGLSRVPSYALQAKTGKVTGRATPRVVRSTPAAIRIDAGFGFAYPAIDVAIAQLTPLARSQGVATAAIFRSHHFGQAGAHVERLAREGLIGIAFSNTPKAMAFHGAAHATLGTNPLAFAAPLPDREPLVIDMALSVVARSKIVAAQHGGQTIPLDWAVDAEGRPTADPAAALQGALLPVGGAKGSALALMVEVLCGALAGAAFGWEASSFLDDKGAAPNMGHVLLALDPQAFAAHDFLPRMRSLANEVEACGARLPGDRRLALRSRAQHSGLTIPAKLHREILAWC
jgi:(2R)-3-sulfolactate dehydrogenase (NADP+)